MEHNNDSPKKSNKWWKVLIVGSITYFLGVGVLIITQNPNIFTSVVILGNFLIPITYVTFFYERKHRRNVRLFTTAASFYYGGFVGVFMAAILEPYFIYTLDYRTAILVGLIEEFTKFLGVLLILRRKQHKLIMDGIILGAAAGMGFAALESTGYSFTAFLTSGGSLTLTVFTTLLRGLLAPLGHGTWTAILVGIFLRERSLKHFRFNAKVINGFLVVVILHGLWDALPSVISIFTDSFTAVLIGDVIVGLIGLVILFRLLREGKRQGENQYIKT